ncbi:DUF488 family protein [Phenylobacterium sp.]|uniref:DUF488 domain-containing protein n=1 Tax=Phenylobacterium sp. TaxID=1871053 RepID=UPI00272EED20|nr:DUF488 domain-containing protein [Phenylobacterium sp.]MDP1597753.1 DUF488 domain-containing protein [Phenylobacterium sp.]MDP3590234.1 DUF488 domain-containing protein [Phenylobacterium sp.]
MEKQPLATIGYERQTQDVVIAKLKAAGVETLVDVRAVASSRLAGFSKTLLAASLAEAGIDYVHLRQLGTPKPGRDAARKGHIAEMTAIFEDHMSEAAAQFELARAKELASGKKVALLCFEADHHGCHRKILAELICEDLGCPVEHL